MLAQDLLTSPFATLPDLLICHAGERGEHPALVQGDETLSYASLNAQTGRVAACLQAAGVVASGTVAIVSATTIPACVAFLAILRAGYAPVPLPPSSTPVQLATMIADCGASLVFADADSMYQLTGSPATLVPLEHLIGWTEKAPAEPQAVMIRPETRFNIIYSSGTTGQPKGIVHTHAMRWAQITGVVAFGYSGSITMVSTPSIPTPLW